MKVCKEAGDDAAHQKRPAPHPGPRCTTCHRAVKKTRSKAAHNKRVMAVYGLTDLEYDLLLEAQGGVCALCRKPFVTKRGSVDHDHALEKLHGARLSVRGIIHAWENTIIGQLGDDPERFYAFVVYLRDPPAFHVLGPREEAA